MKKFILFLCFIQWMTCGFSQWVSSGNGHCYTVANLASDSIGAITVLQNGAYYLPADLTISANDTLYLEESVASITVNDSVTITVKGSMICAPRTDSLIISGESIMDNKRFNLRFNEAPASTLSHLIFMHGNKISLIESNITFENCEFTDFASTVISYMTCDPIIQNCYFHDNQAAAISSGINVTGSPKILNNILYNNVIANTNTPQINIGPSATDSIFIVGNLIEGVASTKSGGIAIVNLFNIGSTKARISNNIIVHNRYGYTQQGDFISALICDNIIQDNNLEENVMNGGSGISIYGSSTNCAAKLRRNLISGNLWGITTINYHSTDMGTVDDPGNNIIYNNGNSGLIYALYNNSQNNMNAIGNYWGDNDSTFAESVIYHQFDQPELGLVTYLPIKTLQPDIISFDFKHTDNPTLQEDVIGIIDTDSHSVTLHLPNGNSYDSLWTPTIVLPLGVTCTPESGTMQVFPAHNSVTYTTTTPHGSSQDWEITVLYRNGVQEFPESTIAIYPNPVGNGQFTIMNAGDKSLQIAVYDMTGKCIHRENSCNTHTTVSTQSWGKGLYFVRIIIGKRQIMRKIVVL